MPHHRQNRSGNFMSSIESDSAHYDADLQLNESEIAARPRPRRALDRAGRMVLN
jgi:hypothetical protein